MTVPRTVIHDSPHRALDAGAEGGPGEASLAEAIFPGGEAGGGEVRGVQAAGAEGGALPGEVRGTERACRWSIPDGAHALVEDVAEQVIGREAAGIDLAGVHDAQVLTHEPAELALSIGCADFGTEWFRMDGR